MKKLLTLVLSLGLLSSFAIGCSDDSSDASEQANNSNDNTVVEQEEANEPANEHANESENDATEETESVTVEMGRVQAAPHGDKSFATVVVAMNGDTIVGASLDEFQWLDPNQDGVVPVPNSDGAFAENYPEGRVLASKVDSNDAYSANMAEKAGSTQPIAESYKALEDFVVGKTIEELEDLLASNSPEEMVDVVSGSTLVDNYGYVESFVLAAKEVSATGEANPNLTSVKMGRSNFAAHGDKAFAVAVVAMDGDTIVGASIDEFQFLNPEQDGVVPVPNSDGAFGEGIPEDVVLASKVDSNEAYSANMAEKAGSTQPIAESYKALEEFVVGKTIVELEDLLASNSPEEMVDVVSGSTLVDNYGYIEAFVDAAKNAR